MCQPCRRLMAIPDSATSLPCIGTYYMFHSRARMPMASRLSAKRSAAATAYSWQTVRTTRLPREPPADEPEEDIARAPRSAHSLDDGGSQLAWVRALKENARRQPDAEASFDLRYDFDCEKRVAAQGEEVV